MSGRGGPLAGATCGQCPPGCRFYPLILPANGSICCASLFPGCVAAQAAQEALSKLSPEERAMFVKMLQARAAASGVTLPDKVAPEPKDLGQVP